MPRKRKSKLTSTRRISVYEVPDPVSGQALYRAAGPFQIKDIRKSLLTLAELIELSDKVRSMIKAKQQSEVGRCGA